MLRRAALVSMGLALALAGCSGSSLMLRVPSCLTGPTPQVGRPVPDEMFALMRRERERAERASSPLVRARILESVPSLFPHVSDLLLAPRCHDEMEREGIETFRQQPLEFSRVLLARVRAVHDAEALVPLASRDEATISEYKLSTDEPGPPPPRSLLRYTALANIPAFWVADNVAEGRRLLLERLRTSRDAGELLLLHGAALAIFEQALWGHPKRAEGTEGPALLASWLPDLKQRLHVAPDRAASGGRSHASLELSIVRLSNVGTYAVRFGVEREARALVNEVLAAKGELSITHSIPGAARDLVEVARGALFDLDTPQESVAGVDLPRPRRERFDVRADWLDREPAGGRVSEADTLTRVRDLDQELTTSKYNAPRCYVLGQLGKWLPPDEAAKRFDSILAPVLEGERIQISTETLCRLNVALGLEGVDEARRVELLVRMLSAPPTKPGDRDHAKDEHHPAIGWPAYDDPVRASAARALAKNPGWIVRHAPVRAWLERQALAPIPLDFASAETWSLLGPAFERTIDFHLSGGPDAKLETAQAILRAWMISIREAESAKNVSHIYVGEVVRARVRALGDRGRRAGLADEIGPFLSERKGRASIVAAYMLGL